MQNIRDINNFLTPYSFRIGYAAKENKYQLIDTKREYVVKRFDTLEEVQSIHQSYYLKMIQDYNKNWVHTALEIYKQSLKWYVHRKFWLHCEVTSDSVRIQHWQKEYSINLTNYSSMEDVKKAISGKIKKLA